ncbi:hypothetical protein CALVIDRAFT_542994 [Calocera viscosa TUFC12733]|uniref:Mid2 domain-containing protein n=1 Tax=Calocera viscosa (strain TUFC12733) TaxID=1330018 RepID=A0A167G1Z1_CALVF|nr:hypothetical protein CALVIDRAFT_542994 [Calocera viscosa TUFC12733]
MIQSAQDFDLMLSDQLLLDGIPNTSPTATHPVVVSGTAIGVIVTGASRSALSTSWISSVTIFASTPTTHSSTSSSRASTTSSTRTSSNSSSRTISGGGTSTSTSTRTPSPSSTSPSLASPTSPSDDTATSTPRNTPLGAIIGGAVGGAVLLLTLLALVLLCRRRNRRTSEYRVSLVPGGMMSPPPPEPAPWFPPMPTPAPPPMTEIIAPPPGSFRTSMYQLGGDAVPYATSPSSPNGPSRTASGYTEDEKRSAGYGEEKQGERWVHTGYGYSRPVQWSPLPAYHASGGSTGSSSAPSFARMQKMYPAAAQP